MLYSARQMDEKILGSLEVAVKTKYTGYFPLNVESYFFNVIMLQVCATVIHNDGSLDG